MNSLVLNNVLSRRNPHERDNNIVFFEEDHKYEILSEPNIKYTSVTTNIHLHFSNFNADAIIDSMMKSKNWKKGHKYWNMTPLEIKLQWDTNKNTLANAGTELHFKIECFYNDLTFDINYQYTNKDLYENYCLNNNEEIHLSKPVEWQYFINFVKDNLELKPYRTEWIIFNEDIKIAGSIDMVYENSDGTLSIYDWKRSKNITSLNYFNKFSINEKICHLPDSNYWHYALQLNYYKNILENKYNKKIRDLFLVRLHPDAKNYELIKLPILTREINDLIMI